MKGSACFYNLVWAERVKICSQELIKQSFYMTTQHMNSVPWKFSRSMLCTLCVEAQTYVHHFPATANIQYEMCRFIWKGIGSVYKTLYVVAVMDSTCTYLFEGNLTKLPFLFPSLVKRFKNVVNCIENLLMPNYRFKGVAISLTFGLLH